jgi:hypothetical protein
VHTLHRQSKKQGFRDPSFGLACKFDNSVRFCGVIKAYWWPGSIRANAFENVELPVRMSRMFSECVTSAANPLTSHDLRLQELALASDVERKASFDKPKVLFSTLLLPTLMITGPNEDIVRYRRKRDHTMVGPAIAGDHLTGAPCQCHNCGRARRVGCKR